MTETPTIQIDIADVTAEQMQVMDKLMSAALIERIKLTEQAFHAMHKAVTTCGGVDPIVRIGEGNQTVRIAMRDYIATMCQVICHPDTPFMAGTPQVGVSL